jgi:hypothetical protein
MVVLLLTDTVRPIYRTSPAFGERPPHSHHVFGESEVLATAKHLVNGSTIVQMLGGDVTYVHILFDQHEIIYAEGGTPTESFFPGDTAMDAVQAAQREELFQIMPELRCSAGLYGHTARMCLKAHEWRLLRRAEYRPDLISQPRPSAWENSSAHSSPYAPVTRQTMLASPRGQHR